MTTTDTNTQKSLLSIVLESTSTSNLLFQIIWLAVRIFVGLLMIHNGLDKLADVPGFANSVVVAIGLPYPIFFTYCAAYIEIVASVLLALGLLTRLSALALLATMLVAIYFHLKVGGLAIAPMETAAAYSLIYVLFTLNGGGSFAVDTFLNSLLRKTAR